MSKFARFVVVTAWRLPRFLMLTARAVFWAFRVVKFTIFAAVHVGGDLAGATLHRASA